MPSTTSYEFGDVALGRLTLILAIEFDVFSRAGPSVATADRPISVGLPQETIQRETLIRAGMAKTRLEK